LFSALYRWEPGIYMQTRAQMRTLAFAKCNRSIWS
jgi:hypothetical protein